MKVHLKVWRQPAHGARPAGLHRRPCLAGHVVLEMLDSVNETLISKGEDPIAFDSDCREGICGTCGVMVDGRPHGPDPCTTVCQLHMRRYKDGDTIVIEPWRARAFPLIKDLVVDRGAFDAIIQAGGYTSVNTGGAPDANAILIP
jgi:succinate dehydrogenase / fumarate reductase iron-sulfur subunit